MRIATARLDSSLTSGTTSTSLANSNLSKMRQRSSTSGSSSVTSSGAITLNNQHVGKINDLDFTEGGELSFSEDQDPFAFDEGDFEPSKWELLSQKEKKSRARKEVVKFRDFENGFKSQMMFGEKESMIRSHHSNEISCLTSPNEEGFILVADCLLASIKVYLYYLNFPLTFYMLTSIHSP